MHISEAGGMNVHWHPEWGTNALAKSKGGVARVTSRSRFNKLGTLGKLQGSYVFPKSYVDEALKEANKDLRKKTR